ncbi:hypothetical protein BRARA_C00841, partial [Brassica rapa]
MFSICCQQGRVKLPPRRQPPSPLKELLDRPSFMLQIRVANGMLSFTSMGGQIDHTVTGTPGPFAFRLHGQTHHRIGSLLPPEGNTPQFLQLYIVDTENEVTNRKKAFSKGTSSVEIDDNLIAGLIKMLDENNHLAKTFRHARDRLLSGDAVEFSITLVNQKHRGRQYDLPTAGEIGGLIIGDFNSEAAGKDIVLEYKSSKLQRISDLHPLFMSLQYPLLFPYGEYGYDERIPYDVSVNSKIKRECMTMREYYAHQIQTRPSEGMTIIKSGKLLHQYIVDTYTATEQERLRFLRLNQKQLRAELYTNVCDALESGDTDAAHLGKKVILPSSFTAGPRYMSEKYQDAMAICRFYGNPHLFITFTANPNWVELKEHLDAYGGDSPNNRPDLECRVFKLKLNEMLSDFKKGVFFPKTAAVVYTIEFQKRGLPHAHILLWFEGFKGESTAAVIDQYITAELPDKDTDREGFELVERHMVHGPCGNKRPQSPCMEKGECTKKYPKNYSNTTKIDKSGFVVYKRRAQSSSYVLKGTVELDNQYVVPHNLPLLKKYQAHINVEWCCKTSAIKYLFKYITKGVDRALLLLQEKGKSREEIEKKKQHLELDEIDRFQECRYISACEASWRLFSFHIHHNEPSVMKLTLHLPGKHRVVIDPTKRLEEVLSRDDIEKTMLTAYFEANQKYEEARELTYIQFPSRFVYHSDIKEWTPRKQGTTIGRVAYVHPAAGDLYYLRIIVNVVKGAFGFEHLATVGGTTFEEYRDACYALGLLDDDMEWHDAIVEPSYWATGRQLRRLFITILIYCEVGNPPKLWDHVWNILAEDILYMKQREFNFPGLILQDEELKQYTLMEIERLLKENDKSLADFPGMPKPNSSVLQEISNTVLRHELNYDREKEAAEHEILFSTMNEDQKSIYSSVLDSVNNKAGQLFFVYGAGGTGKTFLYKTIIAKLRSVGKVVIPVASAGIAALLLPGGRTAHSRFNLPLTLTETTMCEIKYGSMLANLISKTDLIIWDEAPMAHRQAFETLDRTLRDLQAMEDPAAADKPFGGKTVLLGGDFRQILPVITQGSRHDTVKASISKSYLWPFAQICTLTINMRLSQADKEFAKWILEVGNGTAPTVATEGRCEEEGDQVIIRDEFMLPSSGLPHQTISDAAYPNFVNNYLNRTFLTERAILAPTNASAHEINSYLLSKVPSAEKEYLSSDSVAFESTPEEDWTNNYTQEYLNSLEFQGLPTHKLCLKVGAPVMMLRNLDQYNGLCNGTRMVISRLGHRVLEAELLTGTHVGDRVLIPRIQLSPTDSIHPFTFRRRQYPIRLCYAMTINKSQGQSLKQVALYLPRPVFSHGQLYVALSRVTTPDGLKILDDSENTTRKDVVTNIVYREIFTNLRT